MSKWTNLADQATLETTQKALTEHGFSVEVMADGAAAKARVLELIPEQAEVMTMTSVTLDALGLTDELNTNPKFDSVKTKLGKMNRETDGDQMQKIGAAPVWAVGSVHAVTSDGKVVVASNTGSQLPAYAYGAQHVIWVVGTQKVVKDLPEAMQRLEEHTLPLESERAKKAYGVPGSNISKLLIVNNEIQPGRINILLVPEVLGY